LKEKNSGDPPPKKKPHLMMQFYDQRGVETSLKRSRLTHIGLVGNIFIFFFKETPSQEVINQFQRLHNN
jgi:hypothetical protein